MRPLPENRIELWSIDLAGPVERVERLARVLSEDERRRAERFRFDVHRHRFIVGRAAMHELLGSYLDRPPESLHFHYGHRGKPDLPAAPWLHFNLSNSADLALLGVTRVAPLGVDVEQLRPMSDLLEIARRFFARPEVDRLLGLPPERHVDGFFRCWTRKEAYLKAVGEGLAIPLDRFEVTLEPEAPARFLAFDDPAETVEAWSLHHLEPAPGFFGAVALRGDAAELTLDRWPG